MRKLKNYKRFTMPETTLSPRLTKLLDELGNTLVRFAKEERDMQGMPPAAENDKESPAEGEHQDLSQQIDQAGDLAETEAALTRVREQKRQWEIAIEEHSQQYAGLHEQIAAAQNELQRIQEEQWQAEQKTTLLNEREQAVAAQEEELKKREEKLKKNRESVQADIQWLKNQLPSWLQKDKIVACSDELWKDVRNHSNPASTTAGLLIATLSLYTYAERDKTDARAVADALRDVGRRLFSWLKERELGDASTIAQEWADRINSECGGRCEIEVPMPGTPAQYQTMLYQPRAGVSAQSVISVQSWCVRGAKREVIHRAAVSI